MVKSTLKSGFGGGSVHKAGRRPSAKPLTCGRCGGTSCVRWVAWQETPAEPLCFCVPDNGAVRAGLCPAPFGLHPLAPGHWHEAKSCGGSKAVITGAYLCAAHRQICLDLFSGPLNETRPAQGDSK